MKGKIAQSFSRRWWLPGKSHCAVDKPGVIPICNQEDLCSLLSLFGNALLICGHLFTLKFLPSVLSPSTLGSPYFTGAADILCI